MPAADLYRSDLCRAARHRAQRPTSFAVCLSVQVAPEPTRADTGSLTGATARGFLWLLLQSLSGRLGSLLSQLVLAQLLLPRAFGQVGLAGTVTAVVGALVSFGVDDIMLQRRRTHHLWATTGFWASLGLASLGMLLMLVAAPLAARLYGSPGLVGLVAIAAVNLPLGALSTIPTVQLRAAMDFRFLATYASLELLGTQAATIALALAGCGAASFLLPLPVAAAIKAAILWRRHPARIRARLRWRRLRYMLGSGLAVQAGRIVLEAVNQGDYMVLGLVASDTVVGAYYFAFRLAAQPLRMLAGNVGAVLFPALTRLNGDPARQIAAVLRASRLVAYAVTPVCFLQAALAGPALNLLFGAKWHAAIVPMQILSLGLPGDAIAWISGALLIARRQFGRDLAYIVAFAVPFFVCVVLGAELGAAIGTAIAVALYYGLIKPFNSWLIFRGVLAWRDFVSIYITPTLLAGAAFGCAYLAAALPRLAGLYLAQAALVAVIGPPIYVGLVYLFGRDVWRELQPRPRVLGLLARLGIRRAQPI